MTRQALRDYKRDWMRRYRAAHPSAHKQRLVEVARAMKWSEDRLREQRIAEILRGGLL